jgi:hypothetical protein
MYLIPHSLYDKMVTQGDRAVKEAATSIVIRQINNLSDNVKATIQNNDQFKAGSLPRGKDGDGVPPSPKNLQTSQTSPPTNFGQAETSSTNFGQIATSATNFGQNYNNLPSAQNISTQTEHAPNVESASSQTEPTSSSMGTQCDSAASMQDAACQTSSTVSQVGAQTDQLHNTDNASTQTPAYSSARAAQTDPLHSTGNVSTQTGPILHSRVDTQTDSMHNTGSVFTQTPPSTSSSSAMQTDTVNMPDVATQSASLRNRGTQADPPRNLSNSGVQASERESVPAQPTPNYPIAVNNRPPPLSQILKKNRVRREDNSRPEELFASSSPSLFDRVAAEIGTPAQLRDASQGPSQNRATSRKRGTSRASRPPPSPLPSTSRGAKRKIYRATPSSRRVKFDLEDSDADMHSEGDVSTEEILSKSPPPNSHTSADTGESLLGARRRSNDSRKVGKRTIRGKKLRKTFKLDPRVKNWKKRVYRKGKKRLETGDEESEMDDEDADDGKESYDEEENMGPYYRKIPPNSRHNRNREDEDDFEKARSRVERRKEKIAKIPKRSKNLKAPDPPRYKWLRRK